MILVAYVHKYIEEVSKMRHAFAYNIIKYGSTPAT